jgi:hypothetical protein
MVEHGDDLLATPDLIAEKFGGGLEGRTMPFRGVSQIKPALAQWGIDEL